jgi:hypothetical protein
LKTKTLKDFPKLVVTAVLSGVAAEKGYRHVEIEVGFDPILGETFDTMAKGGVPQWFWLLFGEHGCCTPTLTSFDKQQGSAILSCELPEGLEIPGLEFFYLPTSWQAFHVWMVLDPDWGWERKQFHGVDAVAQDYEAKEVSIVDGREIRVWTKLEPAKANRVQSRYYPASDQTLPIRLASRLVPGAWGHEHCTLCNKHIDAGMPGYCDPDTRWVCESCYQRYVARRNLAFVDEL